MRSILATYQPPAGHWVGDGFPVRSLLSYDRMDVKSISPFLLLDYAGPVIFEPGSERRGVGTHPHRGFETVTIVYQGELEHRDSSGGGGLIGEGDVQWMTAGGGIVHEEFHSQAFTERGGQLEMVQLWINLPARDKDTPAAYQTLLSNDIPTVALPNHGGQLRVIAGSYEGTPGPARTFTDINLWDMTLASGVETTFNLPEGHNVLLVTLNGTVMVNGATRVQDSELVVFGRDRQGISLKAQGNCRALLLTGEPIDEPVVGYGPFVMNTEEQIRQAINDYQAGKFGAIAK